MMYLLSGGTRTLRALALQQPGRLGFLVTPRNMTRIATAQKHLDLRWAADNGAYSGFDPDAFRKLLARYAGQAGCLFVVCPDVVADARATLTRFEEWEAEVRRSGQPVAFVGQDGAEDLELPWDRFDAWFIGGSTRWKLSSESHALALEAQRRGKWVHMGRVNTRRRLRIAYDLGCDSVDGSGPTFWGDKYTAHVCRWLRQLHEQPTLFPREKT